MAKDFQVALERGDLDGLRRCAKADLHNHGLGGASREHLRARTGRDIAPLDHRLGSIAEMHAWFGEAVGPLFDDAAGRQLGFEAALVQARTDGVTRLECGEDVWAITLNGGSAELLANSLRETQAATAPEIDWIPLAGLSRHCRVQDLDRWLSPLLETGLFKSLDLSGDEFAQPIENFQTLYRKARAAGLKLKAHVGEWGSADDVWRAVEVLELDEVQHGIAAASSPAVMRALAKARIRLNICPTSNVMLGRAPSLAEHPIRRLFDTGVRVSVNTDDVLVFGSGLSQEFLGLYSAGLFSAAELDGIRSDALADDSCARDSKPDA